MKYRVLEPNEIEAYNIGYKNGSRQAVIKVLEFETPEEKKFYRQGYNAGCQDRKRHNVSTCEIESNVSNVSNVRPHDSAIAIANTIVDTVVDVDSSSLRNTRASKFTPPTLQEVFEYAKQQNDMAGCGGFACSKATAEEFWGNYESNGWIVGNESQTPVRDWKAKLRQWCARERKRSA